MAQKMCGIKAFLTEGDVDEYLRTTKPCNS
jgi:hypothetical protein